MKEEDSKVEKHAFMSKAASLPQVKPTGTSRETEAGSSLTWPRGDSAELWDGPH